jgi:exonuclease SbcD
MALSCPALLNGAPQLAEPEPGGNLPGFRARKLRSRKSGVILRDPGKQGQNPCQKCRGSWRNSRMAHTKSRSYQKCRVVELLTTRFRPDSINVLMAHTHLDGAVLAGSERQVHLGEELAVTAQSLPSTAHYVALGHIHRPQRIESAPSPTYYAGSPIQLDFGEVGEEKSFVAIHAKAGQPAHIEQVPYTGGKSLLDVRLSLPDLEKEAERLRDAGWLRVTVPLAERDIDLNRKVRHLLGGCVVSVDYELPERSEGPPEPPRTGLGPVELFQLYHRTHHSAEAEAALTAAFNDLLRQAEEAPE